MEAGEELRRRVTAVDLEMGVVAIAWLDAYVRQDDAALDRYGEELDRLRRERNKWAKKLRKTGG